MTLIRPLYMQAAAGDEGFDVSATEHRAFVQAALSEGVVGPGDYAVTPRAAGANFTVEVAPGLAVVYGDTVANQGAYLLRSTAVESLPIPAAPPSGSRVHRVIARVRDRSADGTVPAGTYDQVLEVLADTGSGTPPQPDSAITLGLVTVSAGAASITAAAIASRRTLARLPASLAFQQSGLAGETSANNSIGLAPVTAVPPLPYAAWHLVTVRHYISQTVADDEFRATVVREGGVPIGGAISRGARRWTADFHVARQVPANTPGITYQPLLYREEGTGTASFVADPIYSQYEVRVVPA